MYRLTKPRGYMSVVTITNEDTHASIDIGTPSVPMIDTLDAAGILSLDEAEKRIANAWDFNIEKDIADKLFPLAMRMTKPKRSQVKPAAKEKVNNDEIDAMDVLLGLAHYSK